MNADNIELVQLAVDEAITARDLDSLERMLGMLSEGLRTLGATFAEIHGVCMGESCPQLVEAETADEIMAGWCALVSTSLVEQFEGSESETLRIELFSELLKMAIGSVLGLGMPLEVAQSFVTECYDELAKFAQQQANADGGEQTSSSDEAKPTGSGYIVPNGL